MARPLRLDFPGAVYHITARGDRQGLIFEDDADRATFIELLAREIKQQGWLLYAFCLLGNHYHLLLETPEPNLVRGMRHLNGIYTQAFNRRHGRSGHVLQGRYKAIVVDPDTYLRELCRHVVLNPVRAGMVASPADWPWSSYLPTAGETVCPDWLAAQHVLDLLSVEGSQARRAYVRFVADGLVGPSPWPHVKGQIFLGSEAFTARMEKLLGGEKPKGIARRQLAARRPNAARVLRAVALAHEIPTSEALERGHRQAFKHAVYLLRRQANLPLREVAKMAKVSIGRVSQIQTEIESRPADETLARCLGHL
jgi:REP element-mobilizing transposase RayT